MLLQGPRQVSTEHRDMIAGRGVSSIDAGRLAVTAPLRHLQAARSTSAIEKPERFGHRFRNV